MSDKAEVTRMTIISILHKHIGLDKLNMLCAYLIDLLMDKNSDYGDAWQRYGIFTPLIRINDKILRLENLCGKDALVVDENIKDTLNDIVGYGLLALLWLEDRKLIEAKVV